MENTFENKLKLNATPTLMPQRAYPVYWQMQLHNCNCNCSCSCLSAQMHNWNA